MPRILAIDYGTKRVGLAVTDELQIIATALETIHAKDVIEYLKNYCTQNAVETFVVGKPRQMDGSASESEKQIQAFINALKKNIPQIPVVRYDERFTSKIAQQSLIDSGVKKKQRREKGALDTVSAVLILQDYLASKR
ncbi:MAG TPA: Holliday junction resolvase RuvX [Bacteroidia bacterium]|nr:Holliday junction resolvase RuvX [Bacteroidia bacterium]